MSSSSSCADDFKEEISSDECNTLHISEEVIKTLDQVISSNDPLDNPDFEPIDYINSMFPTEQFLSNIDRAISKLESKIHITDDQIRTLIRIQTNTGSKGCYALTDIQQTIRQMFLRILEIKSEAERSEETVKEITKDIKLLDYAKRNLSSAITTLNHLRMLFEGLDVLKVLISKRQYKDIVLPLQAVQEVMKHFENYTEVPQVKHLADEVYEIQNTLAQQITQEFCNAFAETNVNSIKNNARLVEACLLVDLLNHNLKHNLMKWFIKLQLEEYLVLFNESEDNAWLNKIDHRYTWFKKHLLCCEDKFSGIFPSNWKVFERMAVEFCRITNAELRNVMVKRVKEIDVKLLIYAIQRTSNLEKLLAARFTEQTLLAKNDKVMNERIPVENNYQLNEDDEISNHKKNTIHKNVSHFNGMIGECFTHYMYIFIESVDRNLNDLMLKFISESRGDFSRDLPVSVTMQGVLPSCADLFVFYKKFLIQCSQLSNRSSMLSLCDMFRKYLREYAIKVLQNNLPNLRSHNYGSFPASMTNIITRDLIDVSSATSLIQNFLRDEEIEKFSKGEISKICCISTTAEYCIETTQQLQEKLKEKIDPSLKDKINFSLEQDIYQTVISNCIELLVQGMITVCEHAVISMTKIHWQSLEFVGDQSEYISTITTHLKTSVPLIKDCLLSSRKYFTNFCVEFAKAFILTFIQSLFKCKPLSPVGAEQLLLDTHMLKTLLMELPSIGSKVVRKAPAPYIRVVVKGMSKGEMILKIVMTPTEPEALFVDQFLKLLPDMGPQEFQKILEMKGLKSAEKNHLLTVFRPRHFSLNVRNLSSSKNVKSTGIHKLLTNKSLVTGGNE